LPIASDLYPETIKYLTDNDPQSGVNAVHTIAEKLYLPSGGIIAQLEFGAGANPETVKAVYREWDKFRL